MSLNSRLCKLGLLASLAVAAPLWGANTISISGCSSPALVGGTVTCSVNLVLGSGVTLDSLTFSASVTNNGIAPAPTGVAFTSSGHGISAINGSTSGGGFGTSISPVLSGSVALGTYAFTIPSSAAAGQTYTIAFTNAQGSLSGSDVAIGTSSPIIITVSTVLGISTSSLPAATAGRAYSQTLAASGGSGPYTWSSTNNLPPGLTLNATTGVISGNPTTAGTYPSIVVTVTDSTSATANKTLSITVNAAMQITTLSLASGAVGSPYSQTVSATGGTSAYSWSAPALAAYGLSISGTTTTATISGTPTASASGASVTVTITDANGATASQSYSLTIIGPLGISGPNTIPVATVNWPYPATAIVAGGGTAPYTWSAPSLPSPLTINSSTGVISGTPTAVGASPYSVQVTVTDSVHTQVSKTYSLVIDPALVISGSNTSLPTGTVTAAYTTTISATGGNSVYTWTMSPTPLAGLTINATTGVISGTPTAGFNGSVTVTVTDGNQVATSKSYTLIINLRPSITTASIHGATVNTPYSVPVVSTGGTGPYTWSAPALAGFGLSIGGTTSTATISGTPTALGGPTNVTVTVTDANGATTNTTYSLTVNSAPTITGPASLATATVNFLFAPTTMTESNGSAPFVWTATGLPSEMTIDPGTGIITGTPVSNAGSPVNVVVTLTDANLATGTKNYSLTIDPALVITTPATLPTATPGVAYTPQTVRAAGGNGTYTWSASGFPPGMAINALGIIAGTPSSGANSPYSVAVTVTDGIGAHTTRTYSLAVATSLSISGPASLPAGTVNVAYTPTAVTASGGTAPYTWSAAGLPPGLTIGGGTGIISGTPSSLTGTPFAVVVTVTDSTGATVHANFSIAVTSLPLSITTSSLPNGVLNAAYPATSIVAQGGVGAYTWTITGLPPGLTTDASGNISGTPTSITGSPFTVTATVTDAASNSVTKTFPVAISAVLTVTGPATLPPGTLNSPYLATTIIAGGGTAPYTWAATGLPAGLTISAAGVVSGTPTTNTASPYSVTVTVTDNTGTRSSKTYSLVVNPPLSVSGPASLPAGTVGTAYTATTVTATGGSGVYTWLATGLPAGLTIASTTGVISGTPSAGANGTLTVVVSVTDTSSATATKTYSLLVNPGVGPTITGPASLSVATVNVAYTATTITATGGAAPLVWSATGLPNGMSIASGTGIVSGTPTTNAGSPVNVVVTVTDANSATASQTYSLTIDPALVITAPASLPAAVPSVAYTATTVTATGGNGTYTWSATGLPPGLTISAAGVISGAATSNAGSPYSVQVTVTDGAGAHTTRTYSLAVAPPLSISGPASLSAATVNVAYTATTVTATGGSGTYTWSATGLPPGLTIAASTGIISGTPSSLTGTPFAVVVTVTDSNGTTAHANFSIAVAALPLVITTGLMPNGILNVPYTYTSIVAQGGIGNYTWTVTGLPPGLTTDGNGDITGTPTSTTGSPFSVKVTVTDASGNSVSRTFTLVISGTLTVAGPATLPAATLNSPYLSTTVIAGGGAAPYTWVATGLPTGLTINIATGVVSGTPATAAGSPYSVTVTVTDSTGAKANKTYSLLVNAPLMISGPASLPTGTVGAAYTATTVTATGGSGVYTWSASGLPAGLTIASTTGVISGTPSVGANGTSAVVISVTDSSGATATQSYSLLVNPGTTTLPVITSVSTDAGGQTLLTPNTYMSIYGNYFTAVGFTDTWSHSITNGNLPTKLDGVSVMIGSQPAYVEYVSAGQINVLTPNIGLGPLTVTVTTTAGASNAVTVNSQQYIPELFPWPAAPGQTVGQPVATHLDFSLAVANGTYPATTTVPAAPGEIIVLWGDGFGPTTPAFPFGVAVPTTPTYNTSSNVTVMLNNAPVPVYSNLATLTATYAGLFQFAITIPASLPNGTYPINTSINGVTSPTLMLTVHN